MKTYTNLESIQWMLKNKTDICGRIGRSEYNRLLKLLIDYERTKNLIIMRKKC
jgi:hypothetical protein